LKILKSITVIFLSLMICYTSSGMNLFVHVCSGKISNLSFSETETGCGMETKVCEYSKVNHKTAFNGINDCCKNHSLKTNLKVQSSEKTDNLNLFLNIYKINAIISPLLNQLIGIQLTDFDEIRPHIKSLNLAVKKGIYLLFQNFRN
jgi:hypothetical protein